MIDAKRILVVGDSMLDTYYTGDVKRISPEAPVPVFKKNTERFVLGGAANVAANLIAAGQRVSMMTVIGNDETGANISNIFNEKKINTDLVFTINQHTTEKIRFLAMNNQQVLRLDVEDVIPLSSDVCTEMLEKLKMYISGFDLVLISDYLKGLMTFEFTQGVISVAQSNNVPVFIDVKDKNYNKYSGATLIKPNLKELHDLTNIDVRTNEEIVSASDGLRMACGCKYVLTTCGDQGMVLVGDGEPYFIDAIGQEVFDVTGAGDTTISYLATCFANGFSIRKSVDIANLAAGIQVSKVGTSAVYWSEIIDKLIDENGESSHKIISAQLIDSFRQDHKNSKIVFTNGCFDILHIGHIRYLREAAKLGDVLVVGLNSDSSVKRLKGEERPVNCEQDRAEMLCALDFVDYVVVFEEDTPLDLIKRIKPDVLVKGGDYSVENIVGSEVVQQLGGKTIVLPFVDGKSTTNIITKLRKLSN